VVAAVDLGIHPVAELVYQAVQAAEVRNLQPEPVQVKQVSQQWAVQVTAMQAEAVQQHRHTDQAEVAELAELVKMGHLPKVEMEVSDAKALSLE
jgi:hypothetical protein